MSARFGLKSNKLVPKPRAPKLAPKLAQLSRQRLSQPQDGSLYYRPPQKPKQPKRHVLPPPDFSAQRPTGRSIIMEERNIIVEPEAYARHKAAEPRVTYDPRLKDRVMTKDERRWWSNPFLRMLSSGVRRCTLTSRYMTTDLLIRLSLQRVPLAAAPPSDESKPAKRPRTDGEGSIVAILPDNDPEHIVNGRGFYIVCSRRMFERIPSKGLEYGMDKRHEMHPDLTNYIGVLLRQRIIRCLELLEPELRIGSHAIEQVPLIRRLSWAEWDLARETGVLPSSDPDAFALVLFREPKKGPRRKPPEPRPAPAHSWFGVEGKGERMVPLYDTWKLFPDDATRTDLRKKLNAVLNVERVSRWRSKALSPEEIAAQKARGLIDGSKQEKEKDKDTGPSDAYVLCSNAATLLRADVVPTLIALWRLRMWEDVYGDVDSFGFAWSDTKPPLDAVT
ncbi:hypothetical protein EXIGLDRAFT_827741 [Exidia glandulosa HHB12029]|uniref:Uncharacterized protein n=1 Tax=Exidia glandulosa HHB12029 TaxID=1314781 RepID=A0A165QLE2_EXIGL|nr:hypothetical protein EXIGLDRAFT_827741 [Exidia glandulosa HHB12029]